MIWHLYVACDSYRFGTRARSSALAKSRRAVALPPGRPKSVAARISLPLAARGAEPGVAEAEFERDVRRTIRAILYSISGDMPQRGPTGMMVPAKVPA
jgi:hypothetical protein